MADTTMPDATQPVTDASAAPAPEEGGMPADPSSTIGGESDMTTDPAATEAEEMPEGGELEDSPENNGDTSEIDELWGKANTEQRAATLKYIKSQVENNDDEEETEEMPTEEAPAEAPAEPAPMAESVIFTKGQLRRLNEGLGIEDLERDDEAKPCPKEIKKKKLSKNNPFSSPRK